MNGVIVRRGDVTVSTDDRVVLGAPPAPAFPAALRLIHEDRAILVARRIV